MAVSLSQTPVARRQSPGTHQAGSESSPLSALASGDCRLPPAAVVVAHPDDEVIGLGSRLPRLREAIFVHVTDGSPRDLGDARAAGCATGEAYAQTRRREFAAALALAGLSLRQTREMGCVDQEASLQLVDLSGRLVRLLRHTQPEIVLTHPYEGGHPDHDATAFAVHAACRLLEREAAPAPAIVEMTSYHNSERGIAVFEFLPDGEGEEVTVELSEAERELKQRLLACYPTQWNTLRLFPVAIERFRTAPRYDFTRPPHEGTLFYECFPWGMTGEWFSGLASEAMAALGLEGPL